MVVNVRPVSEELVYFVTVLLGNEAASVVHPVWSYPNQLGYQYAIMSCSVVSRCYCVGSYLCRESKGLTALLAGMSPRPQPMFSSITSKPRVGCVASCSVAVKRSYGETATQLRNVVYGAACSNTQFQAEMSAATQRSRNHRLRETMPV